MTLSDIQDQFDTDVLVKINEDDPCAKYLAESFGETDLFRFVLDASWDCHVLVPDLDIDALEDELSIEGIVWDIPASCGSINQVALDSDMSIVEADIPYNVHIYKSWSTIDENIECNDYYNPHMRKARAQQWIINSVNLTIPTSSEVKYYISPTAISALNTAGWSRWNVPFAQWLRRNLISWANWYLELFTSGDFEVSFQIPFQVNKWIHALRMWLLAVSPLWAITVVSQWKEGGASAPPYAWAVPAEWEVNDKFGNHSSTMNVWYVDPTQQFSMGIVQQFYTANGSYRWHFVEWTIFCPFIKASTYMTGDPDAAGVSWIISISWLGELAAGGDDLRHWWLYFDVKSVDDDHDRKYWIKKYWLT
jgi:hypothetical protein